MTPKEFKIKMQEIKDAPKSDIESIHVAMDELMCELLVKLGYKAGVKVFEETDKWWA